MFWKSSTTNISEKKSALHKINYNFFNLLGKLVLSPRSSTELGGTKVFINGPCFNPDDAIICRFNRTTLTIGSYISKYEALCVAPALYIASRLPLELSLNNGSTFNFNGMFRSSKFEQLKQLDYLLPVSLRWPSLSVYSNSKLIIYIYIYIYIQRIANIMVNEIYQHIGCIVGLISFCGYFKYFSALIDSSTSTKNNVQRRSYQSEMHIMHTEHFVLCFKVCTPANVKVKLILASSWIVLEVYLFMILREWKCLWNV